MIFIYQNRTMEVCDMCLKEYDRNDTSTGIPWFVDRIVYTRPKQKIGFWNKYKICERCWLENNTYKLKWRLENPLKRLKRYTRKIELEEKGWEIKPYDF